MLNYVYNIIFYIILSYSILSCCTSHDISKTSRHSTGCVTGGWVGRCVTGAGVTGGGGAGGDSVLCGTGVVHAGISNVNSRSASQTHIDQYIYICSYLIEDVTLYYIMTKDIIYDIYLCMLESGWPDCPKDP